MHPMMWCFAFVAIALCLAATALLALYLARDLSAAPRPSGEPLPASVYSTVDAILATCSVEGADSLAEQVQRDVSLLHLIVRFTA